MSLNIKAVISMIILSIFLSTLVHTAKGQSEFGDDLPCTLKAVGVALPTEQT